MGERYVSNVLMTTAVLLRSGMTRKCHVPFCRAVEGVTLSLTLIVPKGSSFGQLTETWRDTVLTHLETSP